VSDATTVQVEVGDQARIVGTPIGLSARMDDVGRVGEVKDVDQGNGDVKIQFEAADGAERDFWFRKDAFEVLERKPFKIGDRVELVSYPFGLLYREADVGCHGVVIDLPGSGEDVRPRVKYTDHQGEEIALMFEPWALKKLDDEPQEEQEEQIEQEEQVLPSELGPGDRVAILRAGPGFADNQKLPMGDMKGRIGTVEANCALATWTGPIEGVDAKSDCLKVTVDGETVHAARVILARVDDSPVVREGDRVMYTHSSPLVSGDNRVHRSAVGTVMEVRNGGMVSVRMDEEPHTNNLDGSPGWLVSPGELVKLADPPAPSTHFDVVREAKAEGSEASEPTKTDTPPGAEPEDGNAIEIKFDFYLHDICTTDTDRIAEYIDEEIEERREYFGADVDQGSFRLLEVIPQDTECPTCGCETEDDSSVLVRYQLTIKDGGRIDRTSFGAVQRLLRDEVLDHLESTHLGDVEVTWACRTEISREMTFTETRRVEWSWSERWGWERTDENVDFDVDESDFQSAGVPIPEDLEDEIAR